MAHNPRAILFARAMATSIFGLRASIFPSQVSGLGGLRAAHLTTAMAPPKINPAFEGPIKAMIEENPSFGYRTVAWLLGFNKNTVQRIFQLKGWQVRKKASGWTAADRGAAIGS